MLHASYILQLETLSHGIARLVCLKYGVAECLVRVEKPRAIPLADQAVVEIVRTYEFFAEERALVEKRLTARSALQAGAGEAMVYLALGSNIGNAVAHFGDAIAALQTLTGCSALATSGLYRTPATYNTEQPAYLNAVIGLSTGLDPFALLRGIKKIEEDMGRDLASARNSPRPIDIDILLHGATVLDSPTLVIPHKEMHKRLFVMLPLLDVAPADTAHPLHRRTLEDLKHSLLMAGATRVPGEEDASALRRAFPVRHGADATLEVGTKTRIFVEGEQGSADGIVTSDEAAITASTKKGVNTLSKAASPVSAVSQIAAGADGVIVSAGFDKQEGFAEFAKAVKETRCTVFIEAASDAVKASDKIENIASLLQERGVFRWQVVACPDLHSNPEATAAILQGSSLEGLWYPQCWDLTTARLPNKPTPSVAVLAVTAIQQGAAILIVKQKDLPIVTEIAETADAQFRHGWNAEA